MEVVSLASKDVVESPAERWTREQRDIAKTLRTLQRGSRGGADRGQGHVSKEKLQKRFELFSEGRG